MARMAFKNDQAALGFWEGSKYLFSLMVVLGSYIQPSWADDLCSLSSCPSSTMAKSSHVLINCNKRNESIISRCCMSHDGFITGLDLANCSLKSSDVVFEVSSTEATFNISMLKILELEGNPFDSCNASLTQDMSSLEYLSVPSNCSCPGGPDAWNRTYVHSAGMVCEQPIDLCPEYEAHCNNHSLCVMHSPGIPWCICQNGYHGYKCLRQGYFQADVFWFVSFGVTGILCVLSWLAFRRKATTLHVSTSAQ